MAIEIVMEGGRPRRPDARGKRATKPLHLHVSVSVSVSQSKLSWRAAGRGGLMRGGKGQRGLAPPCIGIGIGIAIEIVMEGGRPRGPDARGKRATRPLPLQLYALAAGFRGWLDMTSVPEVLY